MRASSASSASMSEPGATGLMSPQSTTWATQRFSFSATRNSRPSPRPVDATGDQPRHIGDGEDVAGRLTTLRLGTRW